jgi:2-succinyl-6-hydroxy-2,4-cyclohexadiene-1-carboxylate synthase
MVRGGLRPFVQMWYKQPLWASLRTLPTFDALVNRRCEASDAQVAGLAAALAGMSSGVQAPLWAAMAERATNHNLLLAVGGEDLKFVKIAAKMARACTPPLEVRHRRAFTGFYSMLFILFY